MPWFVANEKRTRFLSIKQDGGLAIVEKPNEKSIFNNVNEAISMSEKLAAELNMTPTAPNFDDMLMPQLHCPY